MTQPESKLSRQIMEKLREKGYFCFKVHGSEYMTAGLPDIIVCAQGYFIGLEVKMPGKRSNTSPRQDYIHTQINEAGGLAIVVTSSEEALNVIASQLKSK